MSDLSPERPPERTFADHSGFTSQIARFRGRRQLWRDCAVRPRSHHRLHALQRGDEVAERRAANSEHCGTGRTTRRPATAASRDRPARKPRPSRAPLRPPHLAPSSVTSARLALVRGRGQEIRECFGKQIEHQQATFKLQADAPIESLGAKQPTSLAATPRNSMEIRASGLPTIRIWPNPDDLQ